jgi:hypothetical protein
MSSEKLKLDEFFIFTSNLPFVAFDIINVFDKIFESIDERAAEAKKKVEREIDLHIDELNIKDDLFNEE